MEVVACFLQKYFSLLSNNETQAVKDLYAHEAIVSVTVNGVRYSGTGASLVDQLETVFGNGTVTIHAVEHIASHESIFLSASGSVVVNGNEVTFVQKVSLFHAAKTWYIAFEQIEAQDMPKPAAEEPVGAAEPAHEKAPTPQRSPAVKPKKEVVPVPKEKTEEKAAPVAEDKHVASKPTPAAPTGSWAAMAVAPDKPKVAKTPIAAATTIPVAKTAVASSPVPNVGVHFTLNITDAIRAARDKGRDPKEQDYKVKELVSGEINTVFPKLGLPKETMTRIHTVTKDTKVLVFVDFNVADALDKLVAAQPNVLGQRINPTLQKSENRKL